ncbi:MAG TPA: peptidase S10 [Ideonella sp.]|uniref:S10 family peptidase n=1 Tax=Ideonella sp. TaxID=1929293 RepID=UPI002CB3374E|nr:peptidase S10 [Ideonella sp.]HSI50854.1 peptidase S10 [Ideonella sp.]
MSTLTPQQPAAATPAETEAQRRQREAVQQALASAALRSQGELKLPGRHLRYRIDAGFVPAFSHLPGQSPEPEAAIFTTAYQLEPEGGEPAPDAAQRPVCFAFNGGPGASSAFLHIGLMGPKRVTILENGQMPPPPYVVQDNPLSWLAQFDLVFVDPPHTGSSLSAGDEVRKKHFSVDGDIAVLSDAVCEWLTRHRRWGSPVLLCGESYGTTRCAAMTETLADAGVPLAGLILVSTAMDFQALEFSPRNDLPYALFLPAFAAVAQYHGTLKGEAGASPEAALAAANDFVHREYLSALHRGGTLEPRARSRVARRIGELTGLAPALVEQHHLRISDATFFVEALRTQGRTVGRMDARVTGPMGLAQPKGMEFDPGLDPLWGPFAMAAQHYFGQLGMDSSRRYHLFGPEVIKQWNFLRGSAKGNQYACTSVELARVMRRLPHLRVLVASGIYDLATPVSATDWSLDQLDLTDAVRANLLHKRYAGGHMMYSRESELQQLQRDLVDWLATLPTRQPAAN